MFIYIVFLVVRHFHSEIFWTWGKVNLCSNSFPYKQLFLILSLKALCSWLNQLCGNTKPGHK